MTKRRSILVLGVTIAIMVLVAGYFLRTREQCPSSFTQTQVDASNCIVGASIGPMVDFKYAVAVSALVLIITLFFAFRIKR